MKPSRRNSRDATVLLVWSTIGRPFQTITSGSSCARLEVFFQRRGLIVLRVPRAEDQGHRPAGRQFAQLIEWLALRIEFCEVTTFELQPSCGVMRKPLSQARARRDLFAPLN
jgi:hypothetical protein